MNGQQLRVDLNVQLFEVGIVAFQPNLTKSFVDFIVEIASKFIHATGMEGMKRIVHVGSSQGGIGIADDFVVLTDLQRIGIHEMKNRYSEFNHGVGIHRFSLSQSVENPKETANDPPNSHAIYLSFLPW
jgi:hypothetical protein